MKTTPGPWRVAVTDGITMIDGPRGDVARVLQYNKRGGKQETARHAALIAAAPELLAAAELALPLLTEYRERVMKGEITGRLLESDCVQTDKLRKAIRKAKGE